MTEELAQTLRHEAGVNASLPKEQSPEGARGEPITIGLLIITALSSGAVGAFFNSLTAYFQRSRKLEFTFERPDGESMTLRSENISEAERDRSLERLRSFVGGE